MSPPNDGPPAGQPYRRIYLPLGNPTPDSARMRKRFATLVGAFWDHEERRDLANYIDHELGIRVPRFSDRYANFEKFLTDHEIVDVLSSITLFFRFARSKATSRQETFFNEVRRIFSEENVRYRIDHMGGVHPLVDAMFQGQETAAVADLGRSRYGNALAAFNAYQAAMDRTPPDAKAAIRGVFEANEIVFRLVFPKATRLAKDLLEQHLGPPLNSRYAGATEAQRSSQQVLKAMGQWIDTAHFYRHGQGSEEPTQPPLELAIQLVSAGTAYLRWLIEFDQYSLNKQQATENQTAPTREAR